MYLNNEKTLFIDSPDRICEEFANMFERNHALTTNTKSQFDPFVIKSMNIINRFDSIISFEVGGVSACINDFEELKAIDNKWPDESYGLLTCAEEVTKIISSKNNKKSTGRDNMPNYLIKFFDLRIIVLLATFFNHIIANHHFPQIWKEALITPIPKGGRDSSIILNWRPISQLNALSKILEKIIDIRLMKIVEKNNILPRFQFGFRSGRSTYHPLAILNNEITSGLNSNKMTTVITLDIQSAFDTVWHDGLLHKLYKFKIDIHLIKIIQSFLKNRTFCVNMGSNTSSRKPVISGTPQGSVISPKLFNLYLADIPKNSFIKILQFADDILLYLTHDNPLACNRAFNQYLSSLSFYYANWKLKVNDNKSELLHIVGSGNDIKRSIKNKLKSLEFRIANTVIGRKMFIKYLGVIFSNNYQFIKNIDNLIKKANIAFSNLGKMIRSKFINPAYKRILYIQYIRPIMQYGAPIWLNNTLTSSSQIERLRKLERKIIRLTSNTFRNRGDYKFANNKILYANAGIQRIDAQFLKITINFLAKCRGSIDEFIKNIIQPYKEIKYYNSAHLLHKFENRLLVDDNDRLIEFHVAKHNRNKLVYNVNQDVLNIF